MEANIYYVVSLVVSLFIGWFIAERLINTKKDKSSVAVLIKWFTGLGLGSSLFGVLFLLFHVFAQPFASNPWEVDAKYSNENLPISEYIKEKKNKDFDFETLEFNQSSIDTATIIFTIAGICLGTLGILWLGHLEDTRLKKDREHDQKVQKDRVLSLLSLGIDLFTYIDEKELDFMHKTKVSSSDKKEESLIWKEHKYLYFKDEKDAGEEYEVEYKKQLVSLYRFLYEGKTLEKNSILKDINTIINELEKIFYEKDILLYSSSSKEEEIFEEKRKIFIDLLKQYNDYKNFLEGKTFDTNLAINELNSFDIKVTELYKEEKDSKKQTVMEYLRDKYELTQSNKTIFYEEFKDVFSIEFTEKYLAKNSYIFSIFKVDGIKSIFGEMKKSHLEADKFISIYFEKAFKLYIEEKKEYMEIDLSSKDLKFDQYMDILENAFKQIESDVKAVKELFSLFSSFVKLYNKFDGE